MAEELSRPAELQLDQIRQRALAPETISKLVDPIDKLMPVSSATLQSEIKAEELGLSESFVCKQCGLTVGKKKGSWKLMCAHHPKPKGLPTGLHPGAFAKTHTKRDWIKKDNGLK